MEEIAIKVPCQHHSNQEKLLERKPKAAAKAAKSRQPRTMQSYQKDFYKTYYVYEVVYNTFADESAG
jgi:hypothetical protein